MIDPSKPDLEESVNVTAAHDRVLRGAAAAAREKQLRENGAEPTSMWLVLICVVVGLAAGTALNRAGLFKYSSTVEEGYVRKLPGGGGAVDLPPVAALTAYMKKGEKIYSGKCIGCHGKDGKGDGANYPSLADSKWVHGDSERLAMIILNGLTGPISTGKSFGVMPAQGMGMSDEDLACVMTYVRNGFGTPTNDVISIPMAASALEISGKRANAGAPVTSSELDADHARDLAGDKVDPAMMVDPKTLQAAEAK